MAAFYNSGLASSVKLGPGTMTTMNRDKAVSDARPGAQHWFERLVSIAPSIVPSKTVALSEP